MRSISGWERRNLDEVAHLDVEILVALTPKDFEFYYLDISAASECHLNFPPTKIQFREAPSRARKVVHSGDVLMSMVRPNLKSFVYFNHSDEPCIASTGFAVLRAKEHTCSRFILYSILSEDVSRQINGLVIGSNYPAINLTAVRSLKVSTPPKPEQSKIAEILATVDRAIEQTEALIAKQQRVKTGLMQDLLTRGIDADGNLRTEKTHEFKDSPLGRIPVEWEVVSLGAVADISAGVTLGKTHEGLSTVDLPYLRVANVQDGFLDLSDVKVVRVPKSSVEKYALKHGDVLMNEGGDFDKLGRGTVWKAEIEECLHQNHVFKVRPKSETLSSNYLAAVSSSPHGKAFFAMASKQSTNLASINSSQLKSFPMLLPCYEEQLRIENYLNRYGLLDEKSNEQFNKLRALKTALMQDLLTGRKRVTALLSDPPAPA